MSMQDDLAGTLTHKPYLKPVMRIVNVGSDRHGRQETIKPCSPDLKTSISEDKDIPISRVLRPVSQNAERPKLAHANRRISVSFLTDQGDLMKSPLKSKTDKIGIDENCSRENTHMLSTKEVLLPCRSRLWLLERNRPISAPAACVACSDALTSRSVISHEILAMRGAYYTDDNQTDITEKVRNDSKNRRLRRMSSGTRGEIIKLNSARERTNVKKIEWLRERRRKARGESKDEAKRKKIVSEIFFELG